MYVRIHTPQLQESLKPAPLLLTKEFLVANFDKMSHHVLTRAISSPYLTYLVLIKGQNYLSPSSQTRAGIQQLLRYSQIFFL